MAEDPYLTVMLVTPGGVVTRPFADGHLTMRTCVGHIHDREDGLIAELEAGREPVPWESVEVRDDAIFAVETRLDVDDPLRERLLEHVRATPYYE